MLNYLKNVIYKVFLRLIIGSFYSTITHQMRHIALFLVVFIHVSLFSQENTDLSRDQISRLEKAVKLGNKSNNRQAIGILRSIYEENPNNIDVNYNMGLSYVNASANPDSALFFFDRVMQLDDSGIWTEDDVDLHLAICRARQLKYDFEGAIKELELIRKKNNSDYGAERVKMETVVCQNALVLMANPVRLEVENLGPTVNSNNNDYRPVLSTDESEMYFTSRRRRDARRSRFDDGQYEEAVYCMKADQNGNWGAPVRVSDLFGSRVHKQETATCVANNNTELYVACDGVVYLSKRTSPSDPWGKAEKMPEPINGYGNIRYVWVTADGQQMFFSSDCDGGYGGYDLYHAYRLPNGNWAIPRNMGPNINTEFDEDAPVMHPTKPILYFSSQGHNSMGGMDIFYTIQSEDSTFEAVQNIGFPINTPDDDIYFMPSATKDVAYYASIRWNKDAEGVASTGYDLYRVLYDEPEVNKMAVVKGTALTDNLKDLRITALLNGEEVGIYRPNVNGQYIVILETEKDYQIKVSNGTRDTLYVARIGADDSYYHSGGNTLQLASLDWRTPQQHFYGGHEYSTPGDMILDTYYQSLYGVGETAENKAQLAAAQSGSSSVSGNIVVPNKFEPASYSTVVDSAGYTVQVFALKNPLKPSRLKGLDPNHILEHRYRDGWYVYSYRRFDQYNDAKVSRDHIRSITPYKDAFVRKLSAYKKFLKQVEGE